MKGGFAKYISAFLFVFVLVTPFILRAVMNISKPAKVDGAGEHVVIVTPHVEGIRREFATAFSDWYRKKYNAGVDVDYRSYGGASDIVKLFEQESNTVFKTQGTYQVDLVWGGGDFLFDQQLKNPGYLQGVQLDPDVMKLAFPKSDLNGLSLYDVKSPKPQWFGTALSSFGIGYNRDVDRYLKLRDPLTWADLKNPAYSGWIIAADPTRSASAKQAFMIVVEKAMVDAKAAGKSEDVGWQKGMGLVRQIAANARMFADGSATVPGIIASGDAAAGMTIDFYSRSTVQAVGEDRMGYVEPAGATMINPDPIAMVKGAEHPIVARRFIEFVLSPEGQRLWNTKAGSPGGPRSTNLRRLPIMPSIYSEVANFTDQVNPYAAAGGFNKSNAREQTFKILGELIQASCMNCLEDLRETRKEILASSRAAELDDDLGTFPFDQQEALRRLAIYGKAKPVDQLKIMRGWTQDFRDEYKRLREKAQGK